MSELTCDFVQEQSQLLGLHLGEEQAILVIRYVSLLSQWTKVYNLTAIRDLDEIWSHHVMDCLAVLTPLRNHLTHTTAKILDVGSGGGLPGVLWAMASPDWDVTCIDAVAKKAAFIQQASTLGAGLNHRLHSVHSRVEAYTGQFEVVTSRAFAALPDFVSWTRHLVVDSGCWLAMKGKYPTDEIAALPEWVEVFHVEQLQVPGLNHERCLIWMRERDQS
jgi:16S rRNA (guanine527-N7)-methyltransferase